MTRAVKLSALISSEMLQNEAAQLPDISVNDITSHSGRVAAGGLFLAIQGYGGHGLDHLTEALDARPAAVAWEPTEGYSEPDLPAEIAGICVPDLGNQVAGIADRFFSTPSASLRITGITGTNGKTTTAWLASRALNVLGTRTGYMGTLGYGVSAHLKTSALTTPGVIAVHRRLRELADDGAEALVMEVSSHGLDQGRIDAVRVDTAAFTNLSRDHLDYHGDIESYAAAKAKLFAIDSLGSAVINTGDEYGRRFASMFGAEMNLLTVAMDGTPGATDADIVAARTAAVHGGMVVTLRDRSGTAELHSEMLGAFNAENLLVATGIVVANGYSLEEAATALGQCTPPPGRMQCIRVPHKPLVIVDFAHTPDALTKALQAARDHISDEAPLIVVFGCGGDRDQGKRAEMGRAAAASADFVVLTSDNPRSEDPAAIIDDIRAGIADAGQVRVETDRRLAIRKAIDATDPSGIVLIAGKGSEDYQIIGERTEAFSDVAVASQYMRGLQS
ncbi:MAG: UDP-N-acetylmuramoyl-L-alanyl-D-glutamate--2,6-diaminopimelate ligase [Gammaproteobacteria bacterium]|nr:UDP-N-acetylmuramoyl-L-alanyl-D-glutamate--2,6-diaminopimelate ligase [Gammaproteobacteria bacterium]